ncbi:phage baseplate assembly protein V [Komagataeibacter sp. FNDCF1]|uniref:phage baseplate assembly protein V n=1 Tax=Komagataeibacter sp. FNDCF1 TaxID=2878681 RepID=UPI001E35055C|nr:phage baseplate assembly protein V [Komagataeibacter sp. FNDCF1]MCE2563666.1 phage baseplate assembly protein V [Komagataeibacter sp. FNDCF1]
MVDTRMLAANMANAQAQPGLGLVSAVDPLNHAVKVTAQPAGVETGWIPYAAMQVGTLRIACVPDIGTHVLLVRLEGDGEHAVCACPVYDAVILPPVSPATGHVAQPGELLVVAGCGAPPTGDDTTPGAVSRNAPWWHLTRDTIYSGAGNTTETLTNGSRAWKVDGVTMTLDTNGLTVTGGPIITDGNITAQGTVTGQTDVKAAGISGKSHIHPVTTVPGATEAPQ